MIRKLSPILLSLFCIALSGAAWATPGQLDPGFSGDGKLSMPSDLYYTGSDQGYAAIRQLDGKVVIAGEGFTLMRFNTDWTVDTTFGTNGRVSGLFTPTGGVQRARALVQQSDGKLVAVGETYEWNGSNNKYDTAIVRLNTDGSLDTGFSGDGKIQMNMSTANDRLRSVIQQADGKIVVAGHTDNPTTADSMVMRFNTDGTLDTTFDTDGILIFPILGTGNDETHDIIQQADGKLVLAGWGFVASNRDFAVARLNLDGTLDTTFDSDGKLSTAIGTSTDQATTLIQQADGKLVVGGFSLGTGLENFALVRYGSNGALDTTFGTGGKFTTDISSAADYIYDLAQQADGKLVAAGEANDDYALVRVGTNGSLDTTFDGDGKAVNVTVSNTDEAHALIIQPDDKLLAVGFTTEVLNSYFSLARYNANGSLDTTFDTDGVYVARINQVSNAITGVVAQQADGKVLVADKAYLSAYNKNLPRIFRFNNDGSLDTSFSGDGSVEAVFGTTTSSEVTAMIVQADNRVVVTGVAIGAAADFLVARLNTDGSLDTSFGVSGVVTYDFNTWNDKPYDVLQQTDGKLVIVGSAESDTDYGDFAIIRLNTDGSLDTTFDLDGAVTTPIAPNNIDMEEIYSIVQQPDGKLVAAGYTQYDGTLYDIALARYNTDGSLDTTFDTDGIKVSTISPGYDQWANEVVLQPDGKLVITGEVTNATSSDAILVRYNPDASLDSSFDGDGVVTMDEGGGSDSGMNIERQPDGKFLMLHYSTLTSAFDIHRFQSNGAVDSSFSSISIGNTGSGSFPMLLQMDGRIVLAYSGAATGGGYGGTELVVARIDTDLLNTDGDLVMDLLDSDDDNDGMPDAWEKRYHLNSLVYDPTADTDGDTVSNLSEFAAGTTPINPALFVDKNDFNKDGTGDVLMSTTTATNWRTFNMVAGAVSSNVRYFGLELGPDWVTVSTDDFDADGDTDTLLRNAATGEWKMGCTENSVTVLTGFAAYSSTSWVVAGMADFDANGVKDLLMRDSVESGEWRIFHINDCAVIESTAVALFNSFDWGFQRAEDFDADGDADVLLRNTVDGSWRIFQIQNGMVVSSVGLPLYSGAMWNLVLAQDMNKDGDADILMRSTSGSWRVYTMQGGVVVNDAPAWLYTPLGWTIDHVNDVDKDGDKDILMRDEVGNWRLFTVQNGNISGNTSFNLYNNLQWQRMDLVDVNGNGVRDVVMRNTSTGDWRVFTINAGAVVQNLPLGLYKNTGWSNVNQ